MGFEDCVLYHMMYVMDWMLKYDMRDIPIMDNYHRLSSWYQ